MGWKKGASGNPNGRPPKSRALTEALTRALLRKRVELDGKIVNGKTYLAHQVASALLEGQIHFAASDEFEARSVPLGNRDWREMLAWFYNHTEPPQRNVDVTTGGEKLHEWTDERILAEIEAILRETSSTPNGGEAEGVEPEDSDLSAL